MRKEFIYYLQLQLTLHQIVPGQLIVGSSCTQRNRGTKMASYGICGCCEGFLRGSPSPHNGATRVSSGYFASGDWNSCPVYGE